MIPHSYPSTLSSAFNTRQMVIKRLTSISGLSAWTDYIPVKDISLSALVEGRTDTDGYITVSEEELATTAAKWTDYIPVWFDSTLTKPFTTDAGGYIPVANAGTAAAMEVVRRYSASVYLPGVENFSDSALTSVAVNDGSVGGVKGQVLGAELVTNGDFSNGTTGWTAINGNLTVASGTLVNTATVTGANAIQSYSDFTTEIGKAYLVTGTLISTNATSISGITIRATTTAFSVLNSVTLPGAGTGSVIFTATATTSRFIFRVDAAFVSGSSTVITDNISVRELGYIATQTTAGFKPLLTGGARNLLLNSATLGTQSVTCAATAYTLAFAGTGTVTLSGASTAGPLVGTGASNRVSLTFTPTAGSVTFTVSGSVTSAQLELGSTASPYVPTTSSAASSGSRPKAWLFDGTDDRLSLSGPLFGMSDDHFVVACAKHLSAALPSDLFAQRNSTLVNPIAPALRLSASGSVQGVWRDDAGTIDTVTATGTFTLGETVVASCTKQGNVKTVYRNGGNASTGSTVMGATTLNSSAIGASVAPTVAQLANGPCYGVIAGKGTITTAELQILIRYLGALGGLSI